MKNHFKMIRLMMLIFILPMASSQGCCSACTSRCSQTYPTLGYDLCRGAVCNMYCVYKCPAGSYRSGTSCSVCSPCPAGTFMGAIYYEDSECSWCGLGQSSSSGASVCTDCVAGTYQDFTDANHQCRTCSQCPVGTYLTMFCTISKNTVCTPCPVGYYSSTVGVYACIPCYSGTYQNLIGQTQCKICNSNCPIRQYLAVPCTFSSDGECRSCTWPTTTVTNGQTSCNACEAGYFRNTAGSCLPCEQASGCIVNTYKSCPGGTGTYQCLICSGYTGSISGFCQLGQEPNQVCTGTQTVDSYCKSCAAGYYKSSSTAVWCSVCETGYYQTQTGQSSCLPCSNAGNKQIFLPWGVVIPTTRSCPYKCVTGYVKTYDETMCVPCTGPGIYATGTEYSCLSCTNKPSNSYYLTPVKFNYGSNNCPWDCNAGFYKIGTTGTSCISCPTGTYRSSVTNILVEKIDGSTNKCSLCSGCQENGVSYKSTSCTSTSDTVCFTCKTQCNAGYYQTSPCKDFQDIQCKACNTNCPVGYYLPPTMLQACTGQTTTDVVQAGCLPCYLPSQCASGEYLSGICKGEFLIYNIILSSTH